MTLMPVDLLRTLIAGLIVVCLLPELRAQTSVGELTGRVADSNGRLVPDILIVVEDEDGCDEAQRRRKGVCRWETASGYQGSFFVAQLPPARYRVTILLGYFKPYERVIEIRRGTNAFLDVSLELRGEEHVQVDIPATLVQPVTLESASLSGTTFSREDIDSLPLANGRTLQSFWSLVPGTVVTDSVGTLAQFTTMGQRRFANRLSIDGMSADLAIDVRNPGIGEGASGALPAFATSGGTQTLIPLEAIAEIQVRTMGTTSEHARSPGAQTSIVTRSGGERLMLSAFGDIRPARLAASDWFSKAGQAPHREQLFRGVGASIGGPLLPRRLRYFVTWERQAIQRPVTTTITVPSQSARDEAPPRLRPLLDAFPVPNGADVGGHLADYSGRFPVDSGLWALSGRFDATSVRGDRFFARIGRGDSAGDALGSAPYQSPFLSYSSRETASTRTATAGWASSVGPSVVHDVRMNITTHRGSWTNGAARHGGTHPLPVEDVTPSAAAKASLLVTLFPGPFGSVATGLIGGSRQTQFQLIDTLSIARGRHDWRAGFEYTRVATTTAPAPDRYTYRFGNVENLLRGAPPQATAVRLEPADVLRQSWAAFAQGTFRASPSLSLDYGVRYSVVPAPVDRSGLQPLLLDFQALPQLRTLPAGSRLWSTSWGSVAPRLGATYQLGQTTERTTTVRATWGLSFDDLTSPGATVYGRGYPYVTGYQFAFAPFPLAGSDVPADRPEAFGLNDLSQYFSFPTDLRRPRTHEWQVGIDRALPGAQRLAVSYVGAAGRDLVYWHAYPVRGPRTSINAYSNDANSTYNALLADYVKRMSRGWQARAVYTWSHAIDLDSGERMAPNPPPMWISPSTSRASADFDRRHVLHALVTYQVPPLRLPRPWQVLCARWQVDASFTFRSGGPISVSYPRGLGNGGMYDLAVDAVSNVPLWLDDPESPTGQRLNAEAFRVPDEFRQGTFGRNVLRGKPLRQIDLGVARSEQFGRVTVQSRLEVFNILNTRNVGPPDGGYGRSTFGRPIESYADAQGAGTLARGGLTPLLQTGGPRSIQFSIRVKM